nr:cytochrome c maturase subunit C [Christisonia kwangtungensis]
MSKTRSYAQILIGSRLFLTAMAIHLSLRVAPLDLQQGGNSRIPYVHVPAARMSILVYITTALNTFFFLLTKHPLFLRSSGTGTEMGAFSTLFTLVTGGFRGRPMWGTFWVWDARLTSVFISFLIYLGALFFQKLSVEPAPISIRAGLIDIPIIKSSVNWWNTSHQPGSISRSDISIHVSMPIPILSNFANSPLSTPILFVLETRLPIPSFLESPLKEEIEAREGIPNSYTEKIKLFYEDASLKKTILYGFGFIALFVTCIFVETYYPKAAGVVLSNPLLVSGQLASLLYLFYYDKQDIVQRRLSLFVFYLSSITSLYCAGVQPLVLFFLTVTFTLTLTLFPVKISDCSLLAILCFYMFDPHLARWGFFFVFQLWAYQILTCLLKKARPCPIRLTGMLLVGTFLFYTGTLGFGSVQLFFEGRALIKLAALLSGTGIIYICLERPKKWGEGIIPFLIYFFSTLLIAVEATPTNTTKIFGVASGILIFIAIHLSGVMMIFFFKFIEEWGSLKGKLPLVPFYFSFILYYSNSLPELAPILRWINGIELLLLLIGVFLILEDQMSNKRGSSSHKNRPKGSRAANKSP